MIRVEFLFETVKYKTVMPFVPRIDEHVYDDVLIRIVEKWAYNPQSIDGVELETLEEFNQNRQQIIHFLKGFLFRVTVVNWNCDDEGYHAIVELASTSLEE